ncbi:MAG: hypothetical protein ACI9M9_000387 [Flavobacteriaceae bacterium]|jgi:hypothetical protein
MACGGGKSIKTSEPFYISQDEAFVRLEDTEKVEAAVDVVNISSTSIDSIATVTEEVSAPVSRPIEAFNHDAFNALLIANVSETGIVNYKGFLQNKNLLEDYIISLGASLPAENWTKEDKLAYWINAYNAMTIDLIIRSYPINSIKDLKKPWDQRLWKLGEKWYNLNEIEHQILRKMNDPRIHFGINCASFSCPPLLNTAFNASEVDAQLDKVAIRFINDPRRNSISKMNIEISEIFSWFAKDFKKDSSLSEFLNKYSKVQIHPKARKKFKKYDWSLNE